MSDTVFVPPPPPPLTTAPQITTTFLPVGTLNIPYSETLSVTGGIEPFSFAVTAGSLPQGIGLDLAAGVLSGTPTSTGNSVFIITVRDSSGRTGSSSFNISIPSVPSIANSSLPDAVVGENYFASLVGSGGTAPYGFQITAGGLPEGLTLATTGGITGIPTQSGTLSVTFQVFDSNDPQGVNTGAYTITVQPASFTNPVTSLDECFLVGSPDGGLYIIVPGQRHDEDYNGNPVPILQRWRGVPGPSAKLALMQLGGGTVSAKGNGNLSVTAIDNSGNVVMLSKENRQMTLSAVETERDFMVTGAAKSSRFGIAFDNTGEIQNADGSTSVVPVLDAWFELHVGILWVRPFFGYRKA